MTSYQAERSISVYARASSLRMRRNQPYALWRGTSYVFTLMPRRSAIAARFRPLKKVSWMIRPERRENLERRENPVWDSAPFGIPRPFGTSRSLAPAFMASLKLSADR